MDNPNFEVKPPWLSQSIYAPHGGRMEIKMQDNKSEILNKGFRRKPSSLHTFIEYIQAKTKIYTGREVAKFLLYQAAFFGIAYIFGVCELPFATFPLGVALLCAASKSILPIFSACIFSAVSNTESMTIFIVVYFVIIAIRVLSAFALRTNTSEIAEPNKIAENSKIRIFAESRYLRMLCATLAAFCLSLYSIVAGGFRYYDLFGAVFAMLFAPAAVFLFSWFFDRDANKKIFYEISVLAFSVAIVFSLHAFSVFGISLSLLFGFFTTLYISKKYGFLRGCIFSVVVGLAYAPAYAPMFIFAALATVLLSQISVLCAVTASCILSSVWIISVSGFSSIALQLPAILTASAVFYSADKLNVVEIENKINTIKQKKQQALEMSLAARASEANEEKMRSLAEALSELSRVFFDLSNHMQRPAILDLRHMCDNVFDSFCPDCENREVCWGLEYSTTVTTLARMSAKLHTNGRVEKNCISDYMIRKCDKIDNIVDEINRNCLLLTEQALHGNHAEIFALDYNSMSTILLDALEGNREDFNHDTELENKLSTLLEENGYKSFGTLVYGTRRKQIVINGLSLAGIASKSPQTKAFEMIVREFERISGNKFAEPEYSICDDTATVTLTSHENFKVTHVEKTCSVKTTLNDNISGDTTNVFSTDNDCFYSLISDGMGSGRQAALTSGICSMFIQKMLVAGNKIETTLKMLNTFIGNKGGGSTAECSSTIDLMKIDLITGEAVLVKSGAAASYLCRNNSIYKLQSKTVPLGIICALDAQKTKLQVENGDIFVMVSDGVTGGEDECEWLVTLLENENFLNLGESADKICSSAIANSGMDDISVIVIKVSNNQFESMI